MEDTLWVRFLLDVIFPVTKGFLSIMVSILAPVFAGVIVKWYRKVSIDTIIRRKTHEAVLEAQERFWHQKGSDRYSHALNRVKQLLNEDGITISEERFNSLIPSTVNLLRSGKGWFPEGE